MRVLRTLVPAIAAALVAAAPASAALRPAEATGPLRTERLSNETTLSRWANAATEAPVRTAPRRSARAIDRLHFWTEHGRPEVYLALQSRRAQGAAWVRVRVPGRPNGRTGWVPATALGALHTVSTRLVVDRGSAHATLYRSGTAIWRAPVGVGAPGTPTPGGRFYVRERLRGSGGVYGPWAFGTSAYSGLSTWALGGVIGIHGTNAPQLLPGRPSNGCVRVRNADIRRLVKRMPIGTPIRIR
jgi:lipoprotein-anchoring transpeptidase ErfK/SrfK